MMPRWIIAVPWWLAIFVWLAWLTVTLFLTAAGLLVIGGAGVVYGAGWLIGEVRPGAGEGLKGLGASVFRGTAGLVDRMNGKRRA